MKQQANTLFGRSLPFALALPAVMWQVLFLYVPLGCLLVLSFFKQFEVAGFAHATLENYYALFDVTFVRILFRSCVLATATASLCLLIAYPVAYYLVFYVHRLKNLLLFFLVLPFWTNFLVQVYSWFFILERQGFLNNLLIKIGIINEPLMLLHGNFSIYLVMFYCYLPFMVMPIFSILEQFDVQLIEASEDLGATPRQTFFNVLLPLSLPGIRNGFLLVFIPAFGEFVIPALLGGARDLYVGTVVTHYFLVARDAAMGSAFTAVSLVVLACVVGLTYWLLQKLITPRLY